MNSSLRAALEVKSRFLATISHEVRTPMAAIIGITEMLALQDLGEEANAEIQNVFASSKRLLQLLNNLLDSAKMEAGAVALNSAPLPVHAVIGDIRQLVMPEASKKQLRITGAVDPNVPETVIGDEQKIRQILLNLAFNAVKFTSSGEVEISASLLRQTDADLTIRFTVRDTGCGIRVEDTAKIFEPFVQSGDATKVVQGGSGLGLSISKQLVELMLGTIDLESNVGKGSRFWVDLTFPKPVK